MPISFVTCVSLDILFSFRAHPDYAVLARFYKRFLRQFTRISMNIDVYTLLIYSSNIHYSKLFSICAEYIYISLRQKSVAIKNITKLLSYYHYRQNVP